MRSWRQAVWSAAKLRGTRQGEFLPQLLSAIGEWQMRAGCREWGGKQTFTFVALFMVANVMLKPPRTILVRIHHLLSSPEQVQKPAAPEQEY